MAIWMIHGVASSLRKQFANLGDHQPGDTYGLVTGLIWTWSLVALESLPLAGHLISISSLESWSSNLIFMAFIVLFASTGVGWGNYWLRLIEYKTRLEKHIASGRISGFTQEELDYGEDIGERKLQGDVRPETDG